APPARLHHFKPLDLGTALITVHKDSSQYRALLRKAAVTGCVRKTELNQVLWQMEFTSSRSKN
ncbi:MAG: hypothetical protein AB7I42_29460, partial [Bradyrhizobium sp.]|uniref:hypothetical protein n=1 Tax=Bradyrhizobium sp. TaxID=376 RepID=UPI003D0AF93A